MDPIPVNPPQSGWKPTTSTVAGAALGFPIATLISAAFSFFFHVDMSPSTAMALNTVCVGVCGYLFPDGGRK